MNCRYTTTPKLLIVLSATVLLPIIATIASEPNVFEEDLYVIEEAVDAPDSTISDLVPSKVSVGIHAGASYSPMLWIKESYFDAFAVPVGIFDEFNPWFFSAQAELRIGRAPDGLQFLLPFSFSTSQNSSNEPVLIISNAPGEPDTLPTRVEQIDRSQRFSMFTAGTGLRIPIFALERISLSASPQAAFVLGMARYENDKILSMHYYKGNWYTRIAEDKEESVVLLALGFQAELMAQLGYRVNEKLTVVSSISVSRIWSTVFRDNEGDWVVSGVDGDKREVRLDTMSYRAMLGVLLRFLRRAG